MLEEANKEFLKFTESYKIYGEKIELKIKHTFRVQKLCVEIAKSIGLDEEEIEIAGLCGLLHDIGRFPQYELYQSYDDRGTIDHGSLGYKILKDNNYIRKYNKKEMYDDVILKAVKYHNKYNIPKNMKKKEKLFANIIRDADKLDLLYLYKIDVFKIAKEDVPFSKEVYESLLNKKLVSSDDIKTATDKDALRLGFVFDFNFLYSYQLLKKENYISDTINKQKNMTKCQELIKQLNSLEKLLNNYIEEMITC